jgi:hypothetical protein
MKYMFSHFDYDRFPIIKVTFQSTIKDKEDFQSFLQEWENLYDLNEEFEFIFDTKAIESVSLTYIPKLISHMMRIRKEKKPMLTKVVVQLNSEFVNTLLNMVFKVYKPFCEVVIDYQKNT